MTHLVDIEYGSQAWGPALINADLEGVGQEMIEGLVKQSQNLVRPYTGPLAPAAAYLLRKLVGAVNKVIGGAHDDELDELSEALGVSKSDLVVANLAYDLSSIGCSTFAAPTASGPIHARTLDWYFPRNLLRKHAMVVRIHGAPRGDYMSVSWPGLVGVLTGVAPGRFSVSVNQVRNADDDAFSGLVGRAFSGCWPVMFAVRRAFDECTDFVAAVRLLKKVPLLSPVLLTIVGTRNDQRIVLERTSGDCVVREADADALFVTNHYLGWETDKEEDEDDSEARYEYLERRLARPGKLDTSKALRLLASVSLQRDITAYAAVMEPRAGVLTVRVPGEKKQVFRIDAPEPDFGEEEIFCPHCGETVVVLADCEYRCLECGEEFELADGHVYYLENDED